MDIALIKKIVKLVEESNISGLEIEENEIKIKVTKTLSAPVQQAAPAIVHGLHIPAHTDAPVVAPETAVAVAPEVPKANLHEVRSPIVGTFYRSPTPDADPFVRIGDTVASGQVLCIIEAMKLMNEIESDISGKIVKILVDNGKPVEYNQPLFLVEV
ncbi:MAG: acetyl-CoA carboxylase biotin carboxyl carrier protein [Ignavibacteriales bacterium]|nr:acetyl-CoA carboxylase biotin carboxyl carrier protein [Ignavibacteriales bacterium]